MQRYVSKSITFKYFFQNYFLKKITKLKKNKILNIIKKYYI